MVKGERRMFAYLKDLTELQTFLYKINLFKNYWHFEVVKFSPILCTFSDKFYDLTPKNSPYLILI